jgi:hypothetical protein
VRAEIAEVKRIQMNWFINQIQGRKRPLYHQRLGL